MDCQDNPQDEDEVIGCLPRLLPTSHRDEILNLVANLGDVVKNDIQCHLEKSYERFVKLVDLYLEQPTLLDGIIPHMVDELLKYVTIPSGSLSCRLDKLSSTAITYLACVAKVRGYKIIARLLPHQVSYLERVISCLEMYSDKPTNDLCERRILLYWLWILCKNPFDFKKFDPLDDPGKTLRRIMNVGFTNVPYKELNKEASLVIAHCLSRQDGTHLLDNVITVLITNLNELVEPLSGSNRDKLAGVLALLLSIFKHVDRVHLTGFAEHLMENISGFYPVCHNCDDIGKKLIKLCQRIALVVLRPKLASWRYSRGQRRLEDNLSNTTISGEGNPNLSTGNVDETITIDDEEEDIHTLVEWAVTNLMKALSHENTDVRWSAAKGIGRISSRLPKYLASQVANSILDSNFLPYNPNSSWHGGCMAIAELSRKGCLLPDILEKVFPLVKSALFYEEPMGHHALGSNVRDAACYVLWSFGRAYEPSQLTTFVNQMATSLICAALFDREVSIRRAASAAFQENVGRQANFPNGIGLLTVVDYFAVGVRRKCYTQLVKDVVVYPEYADALVDHLIERKIIHWDKDIRNLSAEALRCLAPLHSQHVNSKLAVLLENVDTASPVKRHGYLMAIANIIEGLLMANVHVNDSTIATVANIPISLRSESTAPKSSGGEITRIALCEFISHLSAAKMSLKYENFIQWHERIEACAKDHTLNVQKLAIDASSYFLPHYLSLDSFRSIGATISSSYCEQIASAPDECIRIGYCGLAANLPALFCDENLFDILCDIASRRNRNRPDFLWAMSRVAALRSAVNIYQRCRNNSLSEKMFSTLFTAMEDYTENQHGEIGRHVRQQAMIGFVDVVHSSDITLSCPHILPCVKKMVQQSGQKIGRTRECAASCISQLLSNPQFRSYIPNSSLLIEIYSDFTFFIQDSSLLTLAPLLYTEFYEDIICSIILSGGGVSDVTTKYAGKIVLDYLMTIIGDLQELERLLQTVANLLKAGMKCVRIAKGVLNFLPHILSRLPAEIAFVDNSKSLAAIISMLNFILNRFSNSPARVRVVLQCFSALLVSDQDSKIFRSAVTKIASQLSHVTPSIRSFAAESLYEALCLADIPEDTLQMLSEAPWLSMSDSDMDAIQSSALKIQSLFSNNTT